MIQYKGKDKQQKVNKCKKFGVGLILNKKIIITIDLNDGRV